MGASHLALCRAVFTKKSVFRVSGVDACVGRGRIPLWVLPFGIQKSILFRALFGRVHVSTQIEGEKGALAIQKNVRQRTTPNSIEISELVLISVLTHWRFQLYTDRK